MACVFERGGGSIREKREGGELLAMKGLRIHTLDDRERNHCLYMKDSSASTRPYIVNVSNAFVSSN